MTKLSREFIKIHKVFNYRMKKVSDMSDSEVAKMHQYGWNIITDDNRKDLFMEMILQIYMITPKSLS